MDTLSSRMIAARQDAQLTQTQLAKRAGCSQGLIGNLESGIQKSSTKLPAIAAALGVEVMWLVEGKGHRQQSRAEPAQLDVLAAPIFPLFCPECHKVSHKAFIELEMNDRLPCTHCGVIFNINSQYGHGELKMFLESLGRSGFILREDRQLD